MSGRARRRVKFPQQPRRPYKLIFDTHRTWWQLLVPITLAMFVALYVFGYLR